MAPTLAGLLVLLGMLGTFIGMVVTLSGTGAALERATDLQTMRDSLGAPVRGLGLAFGTSVAGVAASALLRLMSALCRRERLQAALQLDARMATTLRAFGRAHQREDALQLQQQQAQLLPALAQQLQQAMAQLQLQAQQSNEQLLASQERFQRQAEAAYQGLAASVDQTLQRSLAQGASVAAATLQPAVQATMDGIARETAALHARMADVVGQQLDGVSERFAAATGQVAQGWTEALARQEQASQALAQHLDHAAGLQPGLRAAVGRAGRRAGCTPRRGARADRRHGLGPAGRQCSPIGSGAVGAAGAAVGQRRAAAERLDRPARRHGGRAAARPAPGRRAGDSPPGADCATLEHTAQRIVAQAEAQAGRTLAEIHTLLHTAGKRRAPPPSWWGSCATSCPTAWRATTPCSTSAAACWPP